MTIQLLNIVLFLCIVVLFVRAESTLIKAQNIMESIEHYHLLSEAKHEREMQDMRSGEKEALG